MQDETYDGRRPESATVDARAGDDDRWPLAALASLPGLGPKRLQVLFEHFGSWSRAWSASPERWPLDGVPAGQREEWRRLWRPALPQELKRRCEAHDLTLLVRTDWLYPQRLRELATAMPAVLYARGRVQALAEPCVTMVGTRRCSEYGRRAAYDLAHRLAAAGVNVVSGLAFGIDQAAHEGALAASGKTIAVLAGGAERASPRRQQALYDAICRRGGLVVSEYPPGTEPLPGRFIARNRLLAALSPVLVVVEAPERSGALVTAAFAAEYGRQVMAVTASIYQTRHGGCFQLLRDGAAPVMHVDDIFDALTSEWPALRRAQTAAAAAPEAGDACLTPVEKVVYALLDVATPRTVREILQAGVASEQQTLAAIGRLELRGLCERKGHTLIRIDRDGG